MSWQCTFTVLKEYYKNTQPTLRFVNFSSDLHDNDTPLEKTNVEESTLGQELL